MRSCWDQQRQAANTIQIYGLDKHGLPTNRKEQRRRWLKLKEGDEILDVWPYRDYLGD
jgi:hypothetical protein